MTLLRRLGSRLLSTGVISAGWYDILTGLAMLCAVRVLAPGFTTDRAAPPVGIVMGIVGVYLIERGVRRTWRRREQ